MGDDEGKEHECEDGVSWETCARRADARVRDAMAILSARDESLHSSDLKRAKTRECEGDLRRLASENADARACGANASVEASEGENEGEGEGGAAGHGRREAEDAGERARSAREIVDLGRELENVLESEREMRRELERELRARDAEHANALEALEAKARGAEAAREEAMAEARELQSELNRVETVTRQEENVARLRLEAEHEVRVGRLATELDRVRGELEARSSALENERQKASKASDELKRVRDELVVRLNSDSSLLLETISSLDVAIGACGESLRRADAPAPRMSQIVPSHRDRTSVDTSSTPANSALATATKPSLRNAVSLDSSISSRLSHRTGALRPEASPAQTTSRRLVHAQAPPDRRTKPVTSLRGVVGYANIYAEERLTKRAIV